jgi:hypothetical protein
MGLWDNTIYLATSDVDTAIEALSRVFAHDGRAIVPRPPRRIPAQWDAMQYGGAAHNRVWGIALIPGTGWTALKTAPFELLCERSPGRDRPRLAALTGALGVDGFQLSISDGDSAVLLEADRRGEFYISGCQTQAEDDPLVFHDERINEQDFDARFRLIPVPDAVHDVFDGTALEELPQELGRVLMPAVGWDRCLSNSVQVDSLIPHRKPKDGRVRDVFFAAG